ncbi:hypothetical protein [Staphylococcus equorum]|uniref:hypothetical protein n=1 Tax=Staphylococcus equorum TaxID=246432 RepID=UPI002981F5D6|nr:hypothetical protein [Staphylococcus equorum]MDW5471785.1 hypothetical protein [Staphylococcus equorum]
MNYKKDLPGTWYIIGSTFSMWTKGKKYNPSITYSVFKNNPLTFIDQVQYEKNYKVKSIVGYDKLTSDQFTWRGKGLLKVFTSKWEVLYLDSELLIIQFTSTLVTPSGMDILVGDKQSISYYKKRIIDFPNSFNINTVKMDNMHWLF